MAKEKSAAQKPASTKAASKDKDKKKKKSNSFVQYFKDLRSEIKKVVWPSAKQIKNNTLVVLGFLVVAAVVIWVVDYLLSLIINLVF